MTEAVFWTSIGFIFYAYLGYPLFLELISLVRSRPVRKGFVSPHVSFIITAYNENKRIQQKIENTLEMDYPKDLIEIIVASDCSNDGTDEIVRSYQDKGIKLVRSPERKGKEYAQKFAIDSASGEILVFSDVATILRADAVYKIVSNFYDETVGCVSSTDRFLNAAGKTCGEGSYVRYEMYLRTLETRVNTLVGLSGSFFAARKTVCQNWATDLQSDFNTLLNSIKMGLRGVIDPECEGFYKNISDEKREYDRKVRTVSRGISVFMRNLGLLNPIQYGMFAWQLFSHKLCRWLVPYALITVFVGNLPLVTKGPLYAGLMATQGAFYLIAISGLWVKMISNNKILRIGTFFVLVNYSILVSWGRYFRGDRMIYWEPTER